jgi:hypothetical protein
MSSDGIGAGTGARERRSAPTPDGTGRKALASRINGAKSRGPRTAAGKARSARNALKHGLCARKLLLADENAAAFAAFEKALLADLAPEGALQTLLARQIVAAAWRLARADRLEAEVITFRMSVDGNPALAVIRDGNGARALPTLLRYRGGAHAEFLRTLRTLQAIQADARAESRNGAAPSPAPLRRRARPRPKDFVPARSMGPKPAAAPHPAPARRHPAAPAPAATPEEHRANPPARLPAAQPVRPDAPNPERAITPPALTSPLATTKRTRETAPRQHLVAQRSAA